MLCFPLPAMPTPSPLNIRLFLKEVDWLSEMTESGFVHYFLLFSCDFTDGDAPGSPLSIMASLSSCGKGQDEDTEFLLFIKKKNMMKRYDNIILIYMIYMYISYIMI